MLHFRKPICINIRLLFSDRRAHQWHSLHTCGKRGWVLHYLNKTYTLKLRLRVLITSSPSPSMLFPSSFPSTLAAGVTGKVTLIISHWYILILNSISYCHSFKKVGISCRFGRIPFLALSMFGKLVGAAGNLLAAIYLESMSRWLWYSTLQYSAVQYSTVLGMSRWLWLLVNMLPQNLTGGYLTYIMMTNSFIADNSTPR